MKIKKEHYRLIISMLLIVIIVFSGKWIHKQWSLYQNLIEEKGDNMEERYYYQSMYLEDLEEVTAKILLTYELTGEVKEDIKWLNENYWGIRHLEGYRRYGYFEEKIRDIGLETFIRISNDFLKLYSQEKVKLTDKNIEFLKKVNKKAKEINSINTKYEFDIRKLENKELFYSDLFAKAINEMNDTFDQYPGNEFVFEKEENKEGKLNPEKVFGEIVFSEKEAEKVAKKFLGEYDFGEISESSQEDEDFGDNTIMTVYDFKTENSYRIVIYGQGGKIAEIDYGDWEDYDEDNEQQKKKQPNISKQEATKKLVSFLSNRGFKSLEVIESNQLGTVLEVRFAQADDRYINMVAEINGKVDLSREGKLIELDFYNYWKGLAYDDSKYEQALNGYEKAKAGLKSNINVKEEKLIGRRGEGHSLNFYWRFTTEFDGDDYYIYIDAIDTKDIDITKAKNH